MQKKNVHVGPWPDLDMWTTSVPQRNINEKLSVSCKYICNEILLSVSYKTVQAPVQVPTLPSIKSHPVLDRKTVCAYAQLSMWWKQV